MKTPGEARKAWVEALRSGEYKQGREYLHREGKYCCLGVACHLAVKDGVSIQVDDTTSLVYYSGADSLLPDPVRQWLGLRTEAGDYKAGNNHLTDLAARNDKGVKFARIADIIESEPKGLFE